MNTPHFALYFRTSRSSLTIIVSAFAFTALLVGCAPFASSATSKATSTPSLPTGAPTLTPAPLPPAPLSWHTVTLPASSASTAITVAPSNPATAYDCAAPNISGSTGPIQQPRIWATHDYAAHWTRMANIPANKVNNGCVLEVDQANPAIIVAVLTWTPNGAGGGPDISALANWVSFNGGASWRMLTDTHTFMMSLTNPTATRNGLTYALRGVLIGNVVHNGLWVSNDQMTTWRAIDPPGFDEPTGSKFASSFWISPATGELIAVFGSNDAVLPPTMLLTSHDGGAHWTALATPAPASLPEERSPYLASSPSAHAPLTICSSSVGVTADDQAGDFPLYCSQDDGKTWKTRPNITPVDAAENAPQELGTVFGIASDGSLLALLPSPTVNTLYRLAPGASQWQSLGDVPPAGYTASYYTTASGGVFWTDPASSAPAIATFRTA